MLSHSELESLAPSIFADEPEGGTDKYQFIPTTEVLEILAEYRWFPVEAVAKTPSRHSFHMVTFERITPEFATQPRVVLCNAHDGSSSFRLLAGLLRVACANGLILGDRTHEATQRHRGSFDLETVVASVLDAVDDGLEVARRMEARILTSRELELIGREFVAAVWREPNEHLSEGLVSTTRRIEDIGRDLWRTFNRVQENVLRGGIETKESGRRSSTRGIRDVERRVMVNRALWDVAVGYLED